MKTLGTKRMIDIHDLGISTDYTTAWLICLTMEHNGHKDWRLPTWYDYINSAELHDCWYEDDFYTVYIGKNVFAVRSKEAPL
jgi:hypothetical protein